MRLALEYYAITPGDLGPDGNQSVGRTKIYCSEADPDFLALWELPWETYVLCPCFRASQSHVLKATHGQIGRETGRTLPGLSDAVDPDSLPRQLLESQKSEK